MATGGPIAIAAAHFSAEILQRRAGLAAVARIIAQAGSEGVRLVGFPETFVPGYPYWLSVTPFDEQRALNARYAAESVDLSSDDLSLVRNACRRHRVNAVLGVSERRGGTLFNCQVVIGDDGDVLSVRRKLQPTLVERAIWGQGDGSGLGVAHTSVGRVGGLICGEHSMNLARHALILAHEELHVGAWPGGGTATSLQEWFDGHVAALSRTHAYTGGCFVIAASDPLSRRGLDIIEDAFGEQPKLQVGVATSTVFGPWGTVLASHSGAQERLVIAEADPDVIMHAKMQHDSCGHSARSDILRLAIDGTPYLDQQPEPLVPEARHHGQVGARPAASGPRRHPRPAYPELSPRDRATTSTRRDDRSMVSQQEQAPAYYVMAMQRRTRPVNGMGVAEARESIRASISRARDQVVLAKRWMPDCRLIVLPEFSLTGAPLMGETIAEWTEKAAIDPEGAEFDAIRSIAQDAGVYLAGHAYESDRHFPNMFFAATWLISPSGERLLSYRRLHSSITPSPYDVWDKYLEVYGIDGVLSVAQTELGGISVIPCQEIVFPELSRALALRGCEVLLHPTSEVGGPLLKKHDVGRRARAVENTMYVVSANSAGYAGSLFGDSADGGSEIIDYLGNTMAKAGQGESLVANCEIDLAGLRRARMRANVENLLSRTKTQLWADEYARHDFVRPNELVGSDGSQDARFYAQQHRSSLTKLQEAGVLR